MKNFERTRMIRKYLYDFSFPFVLQFFLLLWLFLCKKTTCARIYRPSFHENKPKTLTFSHWKRNVLGLFSRKLGL